MERKGRVWTCRNQFRKQRTLPLSDMLDLSQLLYRLSLFLLSTHRSWARTWETSPPQDTNTGERWWHTSIYPYASTQCGPLCFIRSSACTHPCLLCAKSLSMYVPSQPKGCTRRPSWRSRDAGQVWEKVSHLSIYISLLFIPFHYSEVTRLLQHGHCIHWAKRHCALVLRKIGQIYSIFVTTFPNNCSKQIPFQPFCCFYSVQCQFCYPLILTVSCLFVLKVQWQWLPMGQVDITHCLYYH